MMFLKRSFFKKITRKKIDDEEEILFHQTRTTSVDEESDDDDADSSTYYFTDDESDSSDDGSDDDDESSESDAEDEEYQEPRRGEAKSTRDASQSYGRSHPCRTNSVTTKLRQSLSFVSYNISSGTHRSSNKKVEQAKRQRRRYQQHLEDTESFNDHEAAREAADALGKDLEAMGYDLNCHSFITKGEEEGWGERYTYAQEDERRDHHSPHEMKSYLLSPARDSIPDPIEKSRMHRSPLRILSQSTNDASSLPVLRTGSTGPFNLENWSISSLRTNTTSKLQTEGSSIRTNTPSKLQGEVPNNAESQKHPSGNQSLSAQVETTKAETTNTRTKKSCFAQTGAAEKGRRGTGNKRYVSGKRATPSKNNTARNNGPPAPSGMELRRSKKGVISKRVNKSALLDSSGPSSSMVNSEERDSNRVRTRIDSTGAVDSRLESVHAMVSEIVFSKGRKGLPPPSRLALRRSAAWTISTKADESSAGHFSSRSESWSRRGSEEEGAENENASLDATESVDVSLKPVAKESKHSGTDADPGLLLKESSSNSATDNVPIVSPSPPRFPRRRHLGLKDVKYNSNSSSRMLYGHATRYRTGALPKRHFAPPTAALEEISEAVKEEDSTASSPPTTFHIEGLSFLDDDKNSEQGRPPVPPGKDELEMSNKCGTLDSSLRNFVHMLKLDDDQALQILPTKGTVNMLKLGDDQALKILPTKGTVKRRTISWFPSRPHRKMDKPVLDLIDDKASGAIEVRPPPTPQSTNGWSQTSQLTNPSDPPALKKEINQQENATSPNIQLEPASLFETGNTIADHPSQGPENQIHGSGFEVKSPRQKHHRKSSVKSLLRKITKVAGGTPAKRLHAKGKWVKKALPLSSLHSPASRSNTSKLMRDSGKVGTGIVDQSQASKSTCDSKKASKGIDGAESVARKLEGIEPMVSKTIFPSSGGNGLPAPTGLDDKTGGAIGVLPPPNPHSPHGLSKTSLLTNPLRSPTIAMGYNQQRKKAGTTSQLEPAPLFATDNTASDHPFQEPENQFHGEESRVESPQGGTRRKSPIKSLVRKISKVASLPPAARFQAKGKRVKNAPQSSLFHPPVHGSSTSKSMSASGDVDNQIVEQPNSNASKSTCDAKQAVNGIDPTESVDSRLEGTHPMVSEVIFSSNDLKGVPGPSRFDLTRTATWTISTKDDETAVGSQGESKKDDFTESDDVPLKWITEVPVARESKQPGMKRPSLDSDTNIDLISPTSLLDQKCNNHTSSGMPYHPVTHHPIGILRKRHFPPPTTVSSGTPFFGGGESELSNNSSPMEYPVHESEADEALVILQTKGNPRRGPTSLFRSPRRKMDNEASDTLDKAICAV